MNSSHLHFHSIPDQRASRRPKRLDTRAGRLPGSIWGIVAYFNPSSYKTRIANYRRSAAQLRQQGLKLMCVELAIGTQEFSLDTNDADRLIQLRGSSILWQKERLLNLGLEELPGDCDKVVWVDADLMFQNDQWVAETCELLERYPVVQPFSEVLMLGRGEDGLESQNRPSRVHRTGMQGMAFNRAGSCSVGQDSVHRGGTSGFSWAARRSIFRGIGFFDTMICGGGDFFMAHSFWDQNENPVYARSTPHQKRLMIRWQKEMFRRVRGQVAYTEGTVFHLWHGELSCRGYGFRELVLLETDFNPAEDLKLGMSGAWEWASGKPRLQRWLKAYFRLRNEDGSLMQAFIAQTEALKVFTTLMLFHRLTSNRITRLGSWVLGGLCPLMERWLRTIRDRVKASLFPIQQSHARRIISKDDRAQSRLENLPCVDTVDP